MEKGQIIDIFENPGTQTKPLGKAVLQKCVYHDPWYDIWIVKSLETGIISEQTIKVQNSKE